ncbi:MAG: 6,7-dimethyl-8-ribityllumazine synthase [Zoogloeaceae bacterium]|jgi:6,7-dimethyl-8-ribityllumazine synthase|nr:6,7-dimethyl-8-ribityllumazine synthase [Zoogloeaceae bacterium]
MARATVAVLPGLNGADLRIGIVVSRFNAEICAALAEAARDELRRLNVAEEGGGIRQFSVPGALEIPLLLQTLAQGGGFDALIALGAVIRGETYHFEVVANDACRGVMETQLVTGVPIANGILTCENEAQARARMRQKGVDCARAAVEMARLIQVIKAER